MTPGVIKRKRKYSKKRKKTNLVLCHSTHRRETKCTNMISPPHEWNNWDLWCEECHRIARGLDKEEDVMQRHNRLVRGFAKRCSTDGHKIRGGY